METRRVPVAEGVELAVDGWAAVPAGADGAPFVLVHGLASNARMSDGVAAALAASGHAAYTVDLRGYGRSSKPDGPYDVPTVADDLTALITRLGLVRPVVAGQSWGGERARRQRVRVAAAEAIPLARARGFTGDHDIHAQLPDELAGVMHELTTDGFFA